MNRPRVLVVDDEEVVLIFFDELLTPEGYEVVRAKTGEEALRLCEDGSFELLVVDKNLPGISGLDLVGKAREKNPDLEWIMITGYPSMESAIQSIDLGASAYITKPLDRLDEVLGNIRDAVEKRKRNRDLKERLDELERTKNELGGRIAELERELGRKK